MIKRKPTTLPHVFFLLVILCLLCPPRGFALRELKPFDHSTWDRFLKKFVNEAGEVDYAAVKKDPRLLESYLRRVAAIPDLDYGRWPREEKLALWLNVYHAAVVDVLRKHYPVRSIQAIPGIWDLQVVTVGRVGYSLNSIRSGMLLGYFRDEKIHTALACGAKGCPKLRREAYFGPHVEGQIFLATREFVNDAERNKIVPGQKKIWLSRLFKWYGKDFKMDFGAAENDRNLSPEAFAVISFVAHYLDDSAKIKYLEEGGYKIKYDAFDWSLNEWHRDTPRTPSAPPASR